MQGTFISFFIYNDRHVQHVDHNQPVDHRTICVDILVKLLNSGFKGKMLVICFSEDEGCLIDMASLADFTGGLTVNFQLP